MTTSRRDFLLQGGAALASAACLIESPMRLRADPIDRPAGLQLYTVTEALGEDYDGTLAKVAAIGYKEVEMAGFFGRKPAQIKTSLDNAGLHCGSVHIFGIGLPETIEYAKVIGAKYIITSILPPRRATSPEKTDVKAYFAVINNLTLDDYKAMGEQCNKMGEQTKKAGLLLGYHNHNIEFKPFPGGTGYDELLWSTDPELVKLELDCGWMSLAGSDPATYITKYPDRCRLLHIKDFKLPSAPSFGVPSGAASEATELGRGNIDYRPIFQAAKKAGIDWYYVEQEPPFKDMPPLEAIEVDYEYVHKLT